ncbi:MAG: hypothetical protein V7L04_15480 [Nostoc sp.]|uniref:hypothetical protein n=1 Tax=Nostoc sp. TaxID=1180 RepID=UPI002FF9A70D
MLTNKMLFAIQPEVQRVGKDEGDELITNAPCPMPHAPCPMPNAPCPMPHLF